MMSIGEFGIGLTENPLVDIFSILTTCLLGFVLML